MISARGPTRATRALTLAASLALTALPHTLLAQDALAGDRRGAITLGAGLGGAVANALSGHCGTTGSAMLSVGARWRVGRRAVVDATTSHVTGISTNDCLYVGETAYLHDVDDGTVATALRGGIEGAAGPVRARALVGVGRLWEPGVAFATAAASLSVGPAAARLLVEVEGWQYRLPVAPREPPEHPAPDGFRARGLVRERTAFLRLGLDVPVGPRR